MLMQSYFCIYQRYILRLNFKSVNFRFLVKTSNCFSVWVSFASSSYLLICAVAKSVQNRSSLDSHLFGENILNSQQWYASSLEDGFWVIDSLSVCSSPPTPWNDDMQLLYMGESVFRYYVFNFLNPEPESGINWKDLK